MIGNTNKTDKQRLQFYIYNRLLGRYTPVFNFICEHVFFVHIVKQKQTKNFADIQNFQKSYFGRGKFLKIRSSISCGHVKSQKNLGPIGSAVLTFIGFKQTDRQAKYIYRYIDYRHKVTAM